MRFHGLVDKAEVQRLMLAAAVVVVPSRWYENQPMVVLEALARGVPVVGSDLGGMPELIEPGATGELVPANDPPALAAALTPTCATRRMALRCATVHARPSSRSSRRSGISIASTRCTQLAARTMQPARRMRPARIAFIGQRGVPATIGGIEHHVEEIGSRLVDRGHEVTVYTRGQLHRRAASPSTAACESATSRPRRPSTSRRCVHSGLSTAVAMLPGADRADILHYHAIGPSVFTPLPRALTRRGVVLTIHGLDYDRDKWGIGARTALKSAGWISAHVPHATITVSKNLADFYLQRYGRVAHYIPNGVAPPVRRAPQLITERFGLAGR